MLYEKEMSFQKQVILVALAIFFISIIVMTITIIIFNNRKQKWSPSVSKCPDYWKIFKDPNNGIISCLPNSDGINSGTSSGKYGFNTMTYPTLQDKAIFATKYDIVWDGITNNPKLMNENKDEIYKYSIFSLFT